jgi:hypothetical protein
MTGVANGNNKGTKVDLQAAYQSLIAGLLAFFQSNDPFALATGDMTRDQVIALFQKFVLAVETTKASNVVWRGNVQAERVIEQTAAPVRAGLTGILKAKFGKSGTQLLKFGITPTKAVAKTTAVMTAAVAKAKATRAARGTKGSKQKKAIVGNVTGVLITPMVAGPASPVTTGNASGGAVAPATSAATTPTPTSPTPPHS